MDQSEEEAFTIVENWWKKSFEISKNTNDPLFSLYTKSFETIMTYMSQSLDNEYIECEIRSLDKDRQLALQSEKGYDAHRCLSFGLIEAVQMMMKKNTKKLEEMIKQGYIPVPVVPKFPLEPKEEEIMEDPELIPAENEISSPSLPQEMIEQAYNDNSSSVSMIPNFTRPEQERKVPNFLVQPKEEDIMDDLEPIPAENEISSPSLPQENIEQPIDDISQDFPVDDQTSPLASIEQDFLLKEEEMMDDDNTGMDDFSPGIDNSLHESPLEDEIMDQPESTDQDGIMTDNDLPMKEGRKSTRRVSCPVKYNSMEDSDEEEVGPIMKKSKLTLDKTSGKDSSRVKCVLCEVFPKNVHGYAMHLHNQHKSTLNMNGIYLLCSCGFKVRTFHSGINHSKECGLQFTVHKTEDEVHSTPKCILCESFPNTILRYANHLQNKHKSTLNASEIYLLCSCGVKVRSVGGGFNHMKDVGCDGLQFTLHKTEDVVTPKCILCERYPKTSYAYTSHLSDAHNTTLIANGIYLLCPCGFKVRSVKGGFNHSKQCNESQFSLHKAIEE